VARRQPREATGGGGWRNVRGRGGAPNPVRGCDPRVETAGVEPAPPRCERGALPSELQPQECAPVEQGCSSGGEPPLGHFRYATHHLVPVRRLVRTSCI